MNNTRCPFTSWHYVWIGSQQFEKTKSSTLLHGVQSVAGDQKLRYVGGERIGHFLVAYVSNALQGQVDEYRISRCQIVLYVLNDQAHQVAFVVKNHRDEEIALKKKINAITLQQI
jgi:hypothetical protein